MRIALDARNVGDECAGFLNFDIKSTQYVAGNAAEMSMSGNCIFLYATAANTVGSVSGFKYNDTSGTLTVKGHTFVCTAAGECTQPLQPAFSALFTTSANNSTGDGTQVNPVVFGTEVFDQNADYNNSTGVLTAPVTGQYQLNFLMVFYNAAGTAFTYQARLITSNRNYGVASLVGSVIEAGPTLAYSQLADMDSGDTAQVSATVSGGTKIVGIAGVNSADASAFSGFLAC